MLKLPRYYEMWFLMKLKDWYVLKCVQDYEPKHCQHLETLINDNPSHEHNEKKWAMMMMSNDGTYILNIYKQLVACVGKHQRQFVLVETNALIIK